MISAITVSGQAVQSGQTEQQKVTLTEDFTQFLQLLTTQLQNQDPLSPMDSNEFTSQLVQFTQVEQAINTNTKLDDLVSLQLNSAATSALGYVGLDVSYVSAEISLEEGKPTTIRYSLEEPAATSKINIYDEENILIYSGEAERGSGVHNFEWNGKDQLGNAMPKGTYVVTIDSHDIEENVITTTTVVTGRVKGIEQQDGVVYTLIGDRAVPIASILNAIVPEEDDGGDDAPTT